MTKEERNALVRPSPGAVEKMGTGASNILSHMVSDAIGVARSQEKQLAETRFRIGNYEFRSPDYRQILLWAEALKIDPITVVERLENAFTHALDDDTYRINSFCVENGAIVSVVWDFESLPLSRLEWVEGLSICEIVFQGAQGAPIDISRRLPSLRRLMVAGNDLRALDLSNVPKLTNLYCQYNHLTKLDLSKVPELIVLDCGSNPLTELDLSNVPQLSELYCFENQLTKLDLSKVPQLRELYCDFSELAELNLSNALALSVLYCPNNQLTKLGLSNAPRLREVDCSFNQLTELDLSGAPELTKLHCYVNQLTELNLSNVPKLTELDCRGNQLTEFDIGSSKELERWHCDPLVNITGWLARKGPDWVLDTLGRRDALGLQNGKNE